MKSFCFTYYYPLKKLIAIGLFYFLITGTKSYAQTKKVAITLDDLPTLSHGMLSEAQQTAYFERILNTLKQQEIKVMGFGLSNTMNETDQELFSKFVSAGHILGSHSHSHPDLNRVTVENYLEDLTLADSLLAPYFGPQKYFRYPYLHRGDNSQKKEAVEKYLQLNGYQVVPVSIDNDEYIYNIEYVKAIDAGAVAKADSIGEAYLQHIAEFSEKFEQAGRELTGRSIKHILLLHSNYINGDYLDDVIRWYRANNWEIISVEEAMQDPVYQQPENYIGTGGLSYLERLSQSRF